MRLAVVPATPLLLPCRASRVDPIPTLRAAVHEAVAQVRAPVVVTVPDRHRSSPAVGVVDPWGVTVARALVPQGRAVVLPGEVPAGTDVLLLADGSARRQPEGGPGVFDPRAEAFDVVVATALGDGDTGALAGLDDALGAELLAAGVPGFHWLGGLPAPARSELLVHEAPYGVGWFVAVWEW